MIVQDGKNVHVRDQNDVLCNLFEVWVILFLCFQFKLYVIY